MTKRKFIEKRFKEQSLRLIGVIEGVLDKYAAQGLDLSLRQLYYQLIATRYGMTTSGMSRSKNRKINARNCSDWLDVSKPEK